jgi:hypothetical protein
MMKRIMATLAAAVVMSTTVALAATPATPAFNTAVKIGEGKIYSNSNRVAIDGTTMYAPFGTTRDTGSKATVRIATSTNSGATWGLSTILASEDNGTFPRDLSTRVAVSNDPLYPGKKIVHAIWVAIPIDANGFIGGPAGLYYAYKANRPTMTGWSDPVQIPVEPFNDNINLMVASNGAIHIVANTLTHSVNIPNVLGTSYITAASPDSPFTVTDMPEVGDAVQAVRDSAGNIYVVGTGSYSSIQFCKKIGSADWTVPVTVSVGDVGGLAVADANNIYISYFDGSSRLAVTTNGGKVWNQKTVLANQVIGNYEAQSAVAVTSGKVITYATTVNDAVKVYRSSDNGATWSAAATVKGQGRPAITVDSANKAHILTLDERGDLTTNPNLLWLKEK